MSIEKILIEYKKQGLAKYKTFFIISVLGWSMEHKSFFRKV